MLELFVDTSNVPKIHFMLDSGYFIAETNRDQKDREKCTEIFKRCADMIPSSSEPAYLKAFCNYLTVKIEVRRLSNMKNRETWSDWCADSLHKAFDNLADLAIANHSPEFNADMWLWLAEIQFVRSIPALHLERECDEFKTRTKIEDITTVKCLTRVAEIADKHESEIDSKMSVRLGRDCLQLSYHGVDRSDFSRQVYWVKEALNRSQYFINNYYWTFKSASTCAKALLQLWALHMYEVDPGIVQTTYRHTHHGNKLWANRALDYCTEEFYHPSTHDRNSINHYLESSLLHLQRLVDFPDGWKVHGANIARVKCLLGKPYQDVTDDFQQAYEVSDAGYRRIKIAEKAGWYQGTQGRRDEARMWFALAEHESECSSYRPGLAQKGKNLLDARKAFYP